MKKRYDAHSCILRFIGEKYEDGIKALRQILIEKGLDPDDENIKAAFLMMPHLQTEHIIFP